MLFSLKQASEIFAPVPPKPCPTPSPGWRAANFGAGSTPSLTWPCCSAYRDPGPRVQTAQSRLVAPYTDLGLNCAFASWTASAACAATHNCHWRLTSRKARARVLPARCGSTTNGPPLAVIDLSAFAADNFLRVVVWMVAHCLRLQFGKNEGEMSLLDQIAERRTPLRARRRRTPIW